MPKLSKLQLPRPLSILGIVAAGFTIAFSIQRLQFLDIENGFCPTAVPSECFWFARPGSLDKIAFQLHLATILPATILACIQFLSTGNWTKSYTKFHRASGYISIFLSLAGMATAGVVARKALGGAWQNQFGMGVLGVAFVFALQRAYVTIKDGRVELHRAWMLRAWIWVSLSRLCFRPVSFSSIYCFP